MEQIAVFEYVYQHIVSSPQESAFKWNKRCVYCTVHTEYSSRRYQVQPSWKTGLLDKFNRRIWNIGESLATLRGYHVTHIYLWSINVSQYHPT